MESIPFDAQIWTLLGILGCFLLSFLFSATETALISLSASESERLATSENWWARSIKVWIDHPNRLLASILLANTLVNTAAAILTATFITDSLGFGDSSIVHAFVTGLVTILTLLFGEITPKMLARGYSVQLAPVLGRFILVCNFILYPVSYVLTTVVSMALRTLGILIPSQKTVKSQDIESLITMARRQGVIPRDKSKILHSVFQFSKRRVKEIMIPKERISAVSVDATLLQVLDVVRQENHSRYPVFKGDLDKIIGFLHARDLFGVLKAYGFTEGHRPPIDNFSLRTCLRRAFFVSEQTLISSVLNEMKSKRIHLAIVKDEWGNVVGLVTLEDILEEVFGEIDDEHDERVERPVVDMYETGVEVAGDTSISDLKTRYDIELESSESYATVNGFIQHYTSHQTLTAKTVVIYNNYVFTILEVSDGEVHRVRITQIPEEERVSS
jgi:putative hemolysin